MPCGSDERLGAPQGVLLLPNKERIVRQALLEDDLPLANPIPPTHVVHGFKAVESPLVFLTPGDVRDELRVESDPGCDIEDAPRHAIRSKKWIAELLRFCCSDTKLSDLAGVPLAVTMDGQLHAFDLCDEPLLITTSEERELLKDIPGLLLDDTIISTPGFGATTYAGIEAVTPNRLISLLPQFLSKLDGINRIDWDPDEQGVPSEAWLTLFYRYIADHAEDCDLRANALLKVPLVPDQFGSLWAMGHESTPLLPSDRAQERLVNALKPFRVPVIDASRDLLKEIRRLVEARPDDAIWRITGRDLIDTLAAVKDDWEPATQSYSPDLHGVILNFLATAEERKGVGERAAKLKSLPIFPATDHSLVKLDSDSMYLPAGYHLPNIESGLGFLDVGPNGQWLPLFESLKVPSLSRTTFIHDVFLPRYGDLTSEEQIELLQWLRTHLEEAYNELDEVGGRRLHAEICDSDLVLCTDGKRYPGRSLYHPDAEEPFGSLLGAGVGFPDMEVYSSRKDSWFRLFERLGMETRPRAIDLLRAIDEAADLHPTDSVSATTSLEKLVGYVQRNWSDLRDVSVIDDPARPVHTKEWTLLEALSARAWLPVQNQAPRGFPRELFADRPPSLSRPSELFGRDQLDLVSLVEPLSQLELGVLGNDIGLRYSTNIEVTLNQFRAVLEVVRREAEHSPVRKRTAALFKGIYRRLGDLFPPHTKQDSDVAEELAAIRDEFANVACVVDEDDVMWPPPRVFASSVPFFLGRRTQVRSRLEPVERGLNVLGRRQAPSPEDFVDFFNELFDDQDGQPVEQSHKMQLREAYRVAAQLEDVEGVLRNACVLTEGGHLEPASDVVIDDAEWLSERASMAGLLILDRQLDLQVARAFGVSALSKAVFERPGRMTENRDDNFAVDCEAISTLVNSTQFTQGLMRLIKATGLSVRVGDLNWLSDVHVRPVGDLFSELVWQDGHEVVKSSEGASDVLFDPDRNEIVASVSAFDVLYERIASVIAQELAADGYNLQDLSPLVAVLRSEPGRISSLLTRLHVPKLIDEVEVEKVGEHEGGGFIDDTSDVEAESIDDLKEVDLSQSEPVERDDAQMSVESDVLPSNIESGDSESDSAATETRSRPPRERRHNAGGASGAANSDEDREGREELSHECKSLTPRDGADVGGSFDGRDRGSSSPDSFGAGRPRPSGSRISRSSRTRERNRRAVTYVRSDGEFSREYTDEVTEQRTEVDLAAIEIVLQYERREGRVPQAKKHFHPGYDIESKGAGEAIERIIEVKGLSGSWNDFGVGVKPRQVEECRREPERFWLYVVEFALEPERAQVFAILNPVSLIDEYRFDGGWKELSRERSGSSHVVLPAVGRRVRLSDKREGLVESVDSRGALMRLTIKLDDGSERKLVYAPSQIQVLADDGEG